MGPVTTTTTMQDIASWALVALFWGVLLWLIYYFEIGVDQQPYHEPTDGKQRTQSGCSSPPSQAQTTPRDPLGPPPPSLLASMAPYLQSCPDHAYPTSRPQEQPSSPLSAASTSSLPDTPSTPPRASEGSSQGTPPRRPLPAVSANPCSSGRISISPWQLAFFTSYMDRSTADALALAEATEALRIARKEAAVALDRAERAERLQGLMMDLLEAYWDKGEETDDDSEEEEEEDESDVELDESEDDSDDEVDESEDESEAELDDSEDDDDRERYDSEHSTGKDSEGHETGWTGI